MTHNEQGHTLTFSTQGTAPSTAFVEGTISCDGSTVHLRHPVHILNRIPLDSTFEATVHPDSTTMLDIPVASFGDGVQRFSVSIDGPLARVSSGEVSVLITEETSYVLVVEPNGLLTENMLIYGTVTISTDEGMSWTVDVELEATSIKDQWWTPLTEPGRIIAIMLSILGLSALTGLLKKEKTTPEEHEGQISDSRTQEEQDPWGRPLDDDASTNAFDVQE